MTTERVESAHENILHIKASVLFLHTIIIKLLNLQDKKLFRTVEHTLKTVKKCEADIQFLKRYILNKNIL